jgi:hypothetical protein
LWAAEARPALYYFLLRGGGFSPMRTSPARLIAPRGALSLSLSSTSVARRGGGPIRRRTFGCRRTLGLDRRLPYCGRSHVCVAASAAPSCLHHFLLSQAGLRPLTSSSPRPPRGRSFLSFLLAAECVRAGLDERRRRGARELSVRLVTRASATPSPARVRVRCGAVDPAYLLTRTLARLRTWSRRPAASAPLSID